MASSAPLAALEDLAYCPVCFEFFNDPQSLSCRHVLCINCVESLVKDEQVECPECRHISKLEEVKKDFNKQNLVEVYLQQQDGTDESGEAEKASTQMYCKTCDKTNKVEWHCKECDQNMCGDCYKVHSSFTVTKNHEVISFGDISKAIASKVDETVVLLKQQKEFIKTKLKIESKYMRDLVALKSDTIGMISNYREELHNDIDKYHDEQVSQVETFVTMEIGNANKRHETIYNYLKETDKRIKILGDLSSSKDLVKMVESGSAIDSGARNAVEQVDTEVRKMVTPPMSEIKVLEPEPWNSDLGTKVILNPSNALSQKDSSSVRLRTTSTSSSLKSTSPRIHRSIIDRDSTMDSVSIHSESSSYHGGREIQRFDGFSLFESGAVGGEDSREIHLEENLALLKKKQVRFRKQHCQRLPCTPWRLTRVRDLIWCTAEDNLYVHSTEDCQLIKVIPLEKVKKVRALVEDFEEKGPGNIIAATKDRLHILNAEGKHLYVIKDGKFSDATIHKGCLYALEYKKKKVVVFKKLQDGARSVWNQSQSFSINYTVGCDTDTLCVYNDGIYISSDVNCCVYQYSHNGDHMSTHGKSGVVKPAELYKPRLACVDNHGNLVVCDCFNNVIKVLSRDWSVITSLGTHQKPMDALVYGHSVYICTSDRQLLKYSLNI